MLYEQTLSGLFGSWISKVADNMKARLKGSQYNYMPDTEVVEALTRAYHEMVSQGEIIRFEWSKIPTKTGYGDPTLEGARAIVKISQRTTYPLPVAVAYANAMKWLYDQGEIDQRDYDPIVYTQTKEAQAAIPAQQEKEAEKQYYINALKSIGQSVGTGFKTVPWIIGGAALLYLLSISKTFLPKR